MVGGLVLLLSRGDRHSAADADRDRGQRGVLGRWVPRTGLPWGRRGPTRWPGGSRSASSTARRSPAIRWGTRIVRPLLVQLPPAYDAEPERRFPAIYVLQGLSNAVDMWRNRRSWQRNPLEEHGCRLGGRGGAGGDRVRRCLDAAGRLAVRRLAGHRPLRHLPVGGRRAVRGRCVPDRGGRRAPRPGRALQRRLRRHGQRHAAAGPVRWLCLACRRRPVRAGLRPGDRTRRQGAARPLRRIAGRVLGGLLRPTRSLP